MAVTDFKAGFKLNDIKDVLNLNPLTNNNSVGFSTGLIGNAADFGASNTNKFLSVSSLLGITSGDIALSWWHKTPAVLNNQLGIVQFMKNGGWSFGAWLDFGNSRWVLMDNNNIAAAGAVTATINTWYHIIVNRTSAGAVTDLYINNSLSGSSTNPTAGTADTLRIGENLRADWNTDGLIAMGYVYNHLLSSTDRTTLFNGGAGYQPVPQSSQFLNFM